VDDHRDDAFSLATRMMEYFFHVNQFSSCDCSLKKKKRNWLCKFIGGHIGNILDLDKQQEISPNKNSCVILNRNMLFQQCQSEKISVIQFWEF
jgi:hypothetical protein